MVKGRLVNKDRRCYSQMTLTLYFLVGGEWERFCYLFHKKTVQAKGY